MAKIKSIAFAVSSISALSFSMLSHAATPEKTGMAMMRLNSSLLESGKPQYQSGSLWTQLRRNFQMDEVNPELVRRHESKFLSNYAYFDRTINRSKPYLYHIANEVKKRNMPSEIALLPFIESAFVTKARSHVGASGLWQFMPATGRHYGLEKTPLYDGRHDVYAATDAALNYLQYLYSLFNDWSLALAAYNWGEGNVGRAINRARAQGLEPTYENLRMPNETRNYVPKLLAVRNLVNNPQAFGISLANIDNKAHFKAITLKDPIDTDAIIRLAQISNSEFLALNPAFNAPVFIPKANRKLLLPVSAANTFEKNLKKASPSTLLSWDVYTPFTSTSISSIAAETGMSVSEIKRLNGLKSNNLASGKSILVAKNSLSRNRFGSVDFAGIDTDNTPDTYRSNLPANLPILAQKAPSRQQNTADIVEIKVEPKPAIAIASSTPAQAVMPVKTTAIATPAKPIVVSQATPMPEPIEITSNTDINIETISSSKDTIPATITAKPIETAAIDIETVDDPLISLVNESTMRLNAAAETAPVLAKAPAAINKDEVHNRQAQIAQTKAKQEQRATARLARATPAGKHRVEAGDTLFNIAQRYQTTVSDLIVANNITGNNIRIGQLLNVATSKTNKVANPIRNVSYTVRKGDTLNTIAQRFNVDVNDIRRWNRNTRTVTPGQKLKLIGS